MKKKIIPILCVVCVVALAALAAFFALQGGHDHNFSTEWTSDGTQHWHACSCGERQDVTAHVYDQEVESEAYRVSGDACEVSYYKSCVCGAKGTDVFVASVNHTYPAEDASEGIKWEWEAKADGGYTVKLTLSCTNASCTHTEVVQIADVKVDKVDPTQDKDGSLTYTATHTVGSVTYTNTKVDALRMADVLVEEIDAILFEELSISSVQEAVLVLHNAYLNLSADQQALVTNADKLLQAIDIINAIRTIGSMELSFTSAATVRLGQTLKLSVNAKDYNGIAPTVTYTVVSGNGTIEADVLSVSDVGSIVVKAVVRYGDYPASVVVEQEIEVAGCDVNVQISLPSGLKYLMDKVVVKVGDQTAQYNASKGIFIGEAVPGETKVTATLVGFESVEKTLNVQLDGSNSVKLTIKDVVYGPAVDIIGGVGQWTEKKDVITSVIANGEYDQSYYKVADGLTGVNTFISATINMKDTTEADNNRGAGLVFASTKDAVYGVILKPGQGTITLVKGKEQDMNKNGLNSDLENVTVYNGSKVVTSNGRVEIVALQEIKGDKTYDYTAKLTVVRLNTTVYVLVDDVVYASFYVAELKDVAGGFGVTNFGHDKATFKNISYSTNKQAAINEATVSVKKGDLQNATVVVEGEQLSGRYLKGTAITATFTPATGKDYLYYSNGEVLSGGSRNADGTVTYQLAAAENITLTAKQVQKYDVSVDVEIPANFADLLDRVTVSCADSDFTYNETTGTFVGRLMAGEASVTVTMNGFTPVTKTVNVTADGENTVSVSIEEMLCGPAEKLGNAISGSWTKDENKITFDNDHDTPNDTSWYPVASGLKVQNLLISANVTYDVGTYHKIHHEGAGFVIAKTEEAIYGIILKPGQGTIVLTKDGGQTNVVEASAITLYNGATLNADNNRVICPAVSAKITDTTDYTANYKLTVVRQNADIYVWIDNILYAKFHVADLENESGEFGLANFNHDIVTYEDLTVASEQSVIDEAASVKVEQGELEGATVTVSGEKWNGSDSRYLLGTELTVTFTPEEGKDYLYYSNGTELTGGTVGENGSVSYAMFTEQDLVLTADHVIKYMVSVEVKLPEQLSDLLNKVEVTAPGGSFAYNADDKVFEGKLLPGEHTITAKLSGFASQSTTCTVAENDSNTAEITISLSDVEYGPAVNFSGYNPEYCTWNVNGNVIVTTQSDCTTYNRQSYYKIADGLTSVNSFISATINFKDNYEGDFNRGAGLIFASTDGGVYGIILKPGQGTITLVNGKEQDMNKNGLNSNLDNVTVYNGATVNTGNGRVNCPALKDTNGDKTYDYTAKLTVVRLNDTVYVLVNDVVYASFYVAELKDVPGGFGVTNFGHDEATYSDITFGTDKQAAINAATISVETGDLQDATVVVDGSKLGDRYLKGTEITVTFTPATGKDYLFYSNDQVLSGGNYGADGTAAYKLTATEDVTLTAQQVQKYDASVTVELPANLANLLDRVVVSSGDSNFTYNATTGKFEGRLIAGEHTVTATLPGLVTATGTVTVAADGENTTSVSITEMLYGPGELFGSSMNGSWAISGDKFIFTRGEGDTADTSWYAVASGLKVQDLLISSKITYVVGTHKADYEGGGFVVAKTDGDDYSIILKPGQGTIVLMREGDQNNVVDANAITTYNGATINTGNNRVNCPALQSSKGKNEYNITAELTVLRQNADIYVWVDDVLYVKFHVDALEDTDAGFGLLDCNHDSLEYADLSVTTEQSMIEKAVTVKVEQGELKGATVTVSGEKWNDRYLLGTKLTVTFTPAEGKEYLYYSNEGEELTGGTAGENNSTTYVVLTEKDIVLTAEDVTKYAVNVSVTLPNELSNLLNKVQVTADGGTFTYNSETGKFEGKLLPGVHTITATLPGFTPKSVDYTVTETGANEAQITIELTDVVVKNPDPVKSNWAYDPATNILTMEKIDNNNSTRFEFAAALPTTQAVISADITFTTKSVNNAGGGIYFACAGTRYGIGLKPGQTGVCFVTDYTQFPVDSMMAYTVLYNGTVKEEYSRFDMPAFDSELLGKTEYETTVKLTVVRQNKEVRVFVNGKLYMQITVDALDGVEGGFGFFNTGHDALKFENITYSTTDAAIAAVFDAATVTVENGELNGATTSVTGQMLSGKYITGTNVAVTFTPAMGKDYIYKANNVALSGGTVGENGSVTFVIPANENIVLSAEDVTMYKVNLSVTLPNELSNLLNKVQVTANGGTFTYNSETGKFEGKLLPGVHTITATLPGFNAKSTTCTVAENDNNTATIEITMADMKYGPAAGLSTYDAAHSFWSYADNVIKNTIDDNADRQSYYAVADGLTGVNSYISATIKMTEDSASNRGAGLIFANIGAGSEYGIILKPGQGTIVLTKKNGQNMNENSLNSDLSNVALYNGATVNTGNGRVNCPGVVSKRTAVSTNTTSNYTVEYKVTVVRLNTLIYVYVDDVLYARFTVAALDGVAGGFGVSNFGHDEVTYSNISLSTDEAVVKSKTPVEHDIKVTVTIPANVANLLEKVQVKTEYGLLHYNTTDKVFEGKLPAGNHTVTATLPGFAAKTATLQVAENGANEAQVTIASTDVLTNNADPTKSTWAYNATTNILTMEKIGNNNSTRFEFANALPTTQAVISADITFMSNSALNAGAGIYIAYVGSDEYGVGLKPGQTGMCYMTNYTQANVSLTNLVNYQNIATDTTTRFNMPEFDSALEASTNGYKDVTAKLTIARQNTKIRVFVNDKLYLEFTVAALNGKESGFGFFNTGHDGLKFENITYNTTDAAVNAAFAATE